MHALPRRDRKGGEAYEAPHWDAYLINELTRVMGDASICGLGQAAMNPVKQVLKHFREDLACDGGEVVQFPPDPLPAGAGGEDLVEMANLTSAQTGVPGTILISTAMGAQVRASRLRPAGEPSRASRFRRRHPASSRQPAGPERSADTPQAIERVRGPHGFRPQGSHAIWVLSPSCRCRTWRESLAEIAYAFNRTSRPTAPGGFMTSYDTLWPGDDKFVPVLEELNRRKARVFVHPLAPYCCINLIPKIGNAIVGIYY